MDRRGRQGALGAGLPPPLSVAALSWAPDTPGERQSRSVGDVASEAQRPSRSAAVMPDQAELIEADKAYNLLQYETQKERELCIFFLP